MEDIRRIAPAGDPAPDGSVWYAAYASTMDSQRLAYHISGGRPPGGSRTYPGCRDRRPPGRTVPVLLPGVLYFALESRVWTGGMGCYDPGQEGDIPARAHLITAQQFSDIAAQEMHREPGTDLDLAGALSDGSERLGPGRYETLVCPGTIDGRPVYTVTAPWGIGGAALNPPSAGCLVNLAAGLVAAHGWPPERAAHYLATRPGAAGHWTAEAVLAVLRAAAAVSPG